MKTNGTNGGGGGGGVKFVPYVRASSDSVD